MSARTALCTKPGIRYTSTTADGVEICFTLSANAKNWLEIRFRFTRATGCPTDTKGPNSYVGPEALTSPGRLVFTASPLGPPVLTIAIHGARAAGTIEDPDFCGGKKFTWSARATRVLPAQALANLRPVPLNGCKAPGIHYGGKTAQGALVCFTLSPNGRKLIASGWSFVEASGCPGLQPGTAVWSDYTETLDASGRFETDVFKGKIRGVPTSALATATGVLTDSDNCPGKTFSWSAHRTP